MVKKYMTDLKKEFTGYNAGKLVKDILSGITVAAVALPLALAFGVSSGADAAAGLVTAIIGGLIIGLLGGASFQISGPTGAMSAILIGIVAQYGLQGVFAASLAAGVIILLAGIFRLGKLVNFIPTSVVMASPAASPSSSRWVRWTTSSARHPLAQAHWKSCGATPPSASIPTGRRS